MPDNNSNKVASVINSIPFGNIIGGPLSACIKAQKEASQSTLQYIREVMMTKSDVEFGAATPATVAFTFQIEGVKKIMTIPLLTLVPIPYIHIEDVDLSFTANITDCTTTSIKASYTSPYGENNKTEDFNTSIQNLIQVDIHATTSEMPSGVAKLLEVFGNELVQVELIPPEQAEQMRLETADLNTLGYISYEHRLVSDIYGMTIGQTQKLNSLGIKTVKDYLDKARTASGRSSLNKSTGISARLILRWSNEADLMRVPYMTPALATLVEGAKVDTVKELRHRLAPKLLMDIKSVNNIRRCLDTLPTLDELKAMINAAKKLTPMLTY